MAGCLGDLLAKTCRAYAWPVWCTYTVSWCTVCIALVGFVVVAGTCILAPFMARPSTGWTSGSPLRIDLLSTTMSMLDDRLDEVRLSMSISRKQEALYSFVKLTYTLTLYGILVGTVCTRQATVLILLELVEFVTVRLRSGSTAAPFGPLFSICLQGTLKVLLKVVSTGAAASRRRDDFLCEADQRARASLPEDLQNALRDGKGRCPITRELMLDPVRTCEWSASRPGVHVYEREAIEEWLQASNRSPCTNLPLEHTSLEPCVSTRNLVTRLLAAQPAPLPLGRWEGALELAAEFAAAMGKLLLSVCLWDIGIDADVVCNRGGEDGGPAVFVWTGTFLHSVAASTRSDAATCAVLEVLPGVKPVAFVRGPDGQLSSSGKPRGGRETRASLERTSVGRVVVAYYPVILYVWIISAVVVLKLVSLTVSGHVYT